MPFLIDTDVAIHLRDGSPAIARQIATLSEVPAMSIVSLVELHAGSIGDPLRTSLLQRLRETIPVLPFHDAEADAYRDILRNLGFDRSKVLDRMIAAQAIVAERQLITINGRDFSDIAGLDLAIWRAD